MSNRPTQVFDNELQGIKSIFVGNDWTVQTSMPMDPSVDASEVLGGMVVYMDPTSKKWKLGCGPVESDAVRHVPHILFHNALDFCVVGDYGNTVGTKEGPMGVAVTSAGEVSVTNGSYVDESYAPGELLTANNDGKVTKFTELGQTVIGSVSTGVEPHENSAGRGLFRLAFYTAFVPTWDQSD